MMVRASVIFLLILMVTGCGGGKENADAISYEQYQEIFNRIGREVKVDDFSYTGGSTGGNVTIVDPELTFGSRSYLTVDGTFDGSQPLTTVETAIFENDRRDAVVLVKLSYTDTVMKNDMIHYSVDSNYAGTNQDLLKKSDLAVLSYKNLVLIVEQLNESGVQFLLTDRFIKEVINLLTEY